MSAKYAIQFGVISIGAAFATAFGGFALIGQIILFWVALAIGVVAIAYALGRPGLLMKRVDGSQPVHAWIILWPYFLLARVSLFLYRWSNRGSVAVAEAVPGIWFARRLTIQELRQTGVNWSAVLDLAAEFSRVAPNGMSYRSLPMLDGAVPSETQLREAVEWINEQAKAGNVLVHCALGHGRTGSVIVAWLLLHGHATEAKTAVAHLRALRQTFGMSKAQFAFVDRFTSDSADHADK